MMLLEAQEAYNFLGYVPEALEYIPTLSVVSVNPDGFVGYNILTDSLVEVIAHGQYIVGDIVRLSPP